MNTEVKVVSSSPQFLKIAGKWYEPSDAITVARLLTLSHAERLSIIDGIIAAVKSFDAEKNAALESLISAEVK